MGDRFYNWVVRIGRPAFTVSSSPVVLHRDRAQRRGAYILASTHASAYDVPCLMAHAPRPLDFMSITELFRRPLVRWFFKSMNTFALDRSRRDAPTVRTVLDRLGRGRVVAMFPEGRIPRPEDSVLRGGELKSGVAGLAQLGGVPIVPCVVLGTGAYARFASWLPLRRTRFGIIFGHPIHCRRDLEPPAARAALLDDLKAAYRSLHAELKVAMGQENGAAHLAPAGWQRPATVQNGRRG